MPVGTIFDIRTSRFGARETVTLTRPIDDLRIFVGAESLSGPRGIGGYDGTDAAGDIFATRVRNDFRGQGPSPISNPGPEPSPSIPAPTGISA